MAPQTGRSAKRMGKKVTMELASQDPSQHKELAIAENVSARGMRVSVQHVCVTGENVQLSSPESGFRTQARVVYCQCLENKKFAVGLELFAPLEAPLKEWSKPH
jgi:hypothetical protein